MKVHYSIEALPRFSNAVITIGTFDGVHEGHRKIISALIEEAKAIRGESILVTFDPHPRKIVHSNHSLQLINTLEEKIELLSKTGIDHVVVVPFTELFSEQSAEDYINDFLISNFQPKVIIIGHDHRFGKGRTGDFKLLEAHAAQHQFRLVEIPKHILDAIGVSSTQIRKAILESDIETANKLLGYSFFFEGKVIHGDKLGRKLGYPTANLEYTDPEKIHLGHGVYAVYVTTPIGERKGMLSIGIRPTLTTSAEKVEVNIFDFDEEIYGETLRITLHKFLRRQEKYPSLEELTAQLHRDKANSLAVL